MEISVIGRRSRVTAVSTTGMSTPTDTLVSTQNPPLLNKRRHVKNVVFIQMEHNKLSMSVQPPILLKQYKFFLSWLKLPNTFPLKGLTRAGSRSTLKSVLLKVKSGFCWWTSQIRAIGEPLSSRTNTRGGSWQSRTAALSD